MHRRFLTATIFFAALSLCPLVHADSTAHGGITLFRTDVTVLENGTLEVVEEIAVNDAASFYKYGFRRVLPISSEDRWDVRYAGEYKQDNGIRVQILEVTEDRKPVKYEQGSGYGYPQLSIGEQNVPFDSGKHRFIIHYMVESAMNLSGARDTLYWNANGHGHEAPIEYAILSVRLPEGVPSDSVTVEPRVAGRGVSNPRQQETVLIASTTVTAPLSIAL